jgi:lactoylglutathione lyase
MASPCRLRIKDPKEAVPFFVENFGFKLLHKYDFPQWSFALYFLIIPRDDEILPEPCTEASEAYLWTMSGSCLELTHNYGSEVDPDFKVNNGNVEPHRGFGHIAVMTRDVYAASAELEAAGVRFQKRPDEGRMKGIAFCLTPEGYWVEIVRRGENSPVASKYTLAQTMIRVKDPVKSLHFYCDLLGMSLIQESHFSDFSLYFLAQLPPGTTLPEKGSAEAAEFIRNMYPQVLELTWNHGTEANPAFRYHNGNDQDAGQIRGFGHTGFLVDGLELACEALEKDGVAFKKRPLEGTMRGLAFAYDPDGYCNMAAGCPADVRRGGDYSARRNQDVM